jgi:hypothetical protein
MRNQKSEEFAEYRFGKRGILHRGDRFRVTGGPMYVTDAGKEIPVYDRGVFVFRRYCQQGSHRWIEACAEGTTATVILQISKRSRSPAIPNLRRRPYRVIGRVGIRDRGQSTDSRRPPSSSPIP